MIPLLIPLLISVGLGVIGTSIIIYILVNERITKKTIGQQIKENIEKNNYNEVNIGLKDANVKITDISEKEGETYVTYEAYGKYYGLRSPNGTSLHKNEKLKY